MIERIARHLCKETNADPDGLYYPPSRGNRDRILSRAPDERVPGWTFEIGRARALLAVMREPSEEMLTAADEARAFTSRPVGDKALYRVMIDAASIGTAGEDESET